jgi:hypothetical protein
MLKYLRIAVTALSLTACVLLVALWVRSYWWRDILEKRTASQLLQLDSLTGRITFWQFNPGTPKTPPREIKILLDGMAMGRFYGCVPVVNGTPPRPFWHQASILSFGRFGEGFSRVTFVPYWFPVIVSAACAALPWVRWSRRFSLRTLLITTSLVAVAVALWILATGRF